MDKREFPSELAEALIAHALAIKEGSEQVAEAIRDLAEAVREHGQEVKRGGSR